MSLMDTIKTEFEKARADGAAIFEYVTHRAEAALQQEVAVLKADEEKLVADLKDKLEQAKAAALATVQSEDPAAVAAVQKAVAAIEAEVLAVIEQHLVP